jgi:Alginate export
MKTPASLFASFCLAGVSIAGPAQVAPPIQPAPPANPLSFFDGKVTFDLQERLRWEVRDNNFDFDRGVNALTDDNWFLNRLRIGLAIKPVSWLKIYAQGQDVREINSDRPDFPGILGAEGDDAFDLRQGYVEISQYDKCPWGLKLGRQVLEYGDGRLIGPSEWANLSRSFDAAKLRYQTKDWWLDAFASSVAVINRGEYNQSDFFNGNETHREQIFSGLYFSSTGLIPVQTTDLYVLHLHEATGPLYQPAAIGDTNFVTLGFRIKSKPGAFHHEPAPASDGKTVADGKSAPPPPPPAAKKALGFDYEAEAAFQTGDVRGLDLTAFAVHVGGGYTFEVPWTPRVSLEYNYASGDSSSADTDIETFQNLFPSNHPPYGNMDLFSWQNVHNPAIVIKATPCKNLTVQLEYHGFWLANNDDTWYRSGGTAVRPLTPAARTADSFVGTEFDFIATWKPFKQLGFQAGYCHFFAGDYVQDTGPSSDADFGYVQATIEF